MLGYKAILTGSRTIGLLGEVAGSVDHVKSPNDVKSRQSSSLSHSSLSASCSD